MDFKEILDQITNRWIISRRHDLVAELDKSPEGAATGGEVIGLYAGFLLELKQSNPTAFYEIGDLVDEFAKECAAYGTILKGYNYKAYWRK